MEMILFWKSESEMAPHIQIGSSEHSWQKLRCRHFRRDGQSSNEEELEASERHMLRIFDASVT
jgi:hypothetical protein